MNRRFQFRADDGLLATIELAANQARMTAADFVRQAAIRAAHECGFDLPARPQEDAR